MKKIAELSLISLVLVLALIYGKSLILPFLTALLLWVLVRAMREAINRWKFAAEKIPSWVKTTLCGGIILLALIFVSKVIGSSVESLSSSYAQYEKNIQSVTQNLETSLGIDLGTFLKNNAGSLDYKSILSGVFGAVTDLLGDAFMILIYALFLFLEERNFGTKLRLLFSTSDDRESVQKMLDAIEDSVSQYLGLKALVSLMTGILSYLALYFIGIDSPEFWAFLIFLLNFIPTIGSLIATLFPTVFCLVQFADPIPALWTLGIVGGIQVLVGNVVEPKIMGNSLNISALVAILALSFWGVLWGITGMILSTPITVILVIVCSQFPQTKSLAILLSEKGRIEKA